MVTVSFYGLHAQGDTSLNLLDDTDPGLPVHVDNEFKTTHVINLQSLMLTDPGILDFRINHRFGQLNSGAYQAFGFDQAITKIGFEYGVLPGLMVGLGRTTLDKTADAYFKYRLLRQRTDNKVPFSVLAFGSGAYRNIKFGFDKTQSGKEIDMVMRMAWTGQLIIGRKFSESFSMQLSPSVVHYNLTPLGTDNTLYALGLGLRQKVTPRTSINLEWIPVFGRDGQYRNSFSIGCDIETGGHVFQLHLTNSQGNMESQYIARTAADWMDGGIHFGFNISRVFTLVHPSRFRKL